MICEIKRFRRRLQYCFCTLLQQSEGSVKTLNVKKYHEVSPKFFNKIDLICNNLIFHAILLFKSVLANHITTDLCSLLILYNGGKLLMSIRAL